MQIVNTKGAAAKLGCSENWIHKLVSRGKLKAHIFIEGELVEHIPDGGRAKQGQGLYFLERDLKSYQPKDKGRPMGRKDVIENNPKRKGRPKKATEENTGKQCLTKLSAYINPAFRLVTSLKPTLSLKYIIEIASPTLLPLFPLLINKWRR